MASLESISERLILTPADDAALPRLIERLRRVFGLAYIAVAREVPSPLERLGPAACEMMVEANPRNFAVRVKMADSGYGMNSMEVEVELGRIVLEHLRGSDASVRVKLNNPEVSCQVEVVPGKAMIYAERVEGPWRPACGDQRTPGSAAFRRVRLLRRSVQNDAPRKPRFLRPLLRHAIGFRAIPPRAWRRKSGPHAHSLPIHLAPLSGSL